jgi:hypothetical protein
VEGGSERRGAKVDAAEFHRQVLIGHRGECGCSTYVLFWFLFHFRGRG